MTMFILSPSGLNFGGIEAQVLRPMITALETCEPSEDGG